jgi:hypothetical protein
MQKNVKVQTEWGPVDIELTQCDGPSCTSCMQSSFMVGWLRLEPLGVQVAAFGRPPDPQDFCSLNCLGKAFGLATGTP